jgi:TPR repeat protein
MRKLTATIFLTVAVLLGSTGMSWGVQPVKGYCLSGTKHSRCPISSQCSSVYKSGNYITALREWGSLAKQGNAFAQNALGNLYDAGRGVPKDDKSAVKWRTLAAEQGIPQKV